MAAKGRFHCCAPHVSSRGPEMEWIQNHCEAKTLIVQDQWIDHANDMKKNLTTVEHYISLGWTTLTSTATSPMRDIIAKASPEEPAVEVKPEEPMGNHVHRRHHRSAEGRDQDARIMFRPVLHRNFRS